MDMQEFIISLGEKFKNNPEELLSFLKMISDNRLAERETYLRMGGAGYELSAKGYPHLGLFLNKKALEYFIRVNDDQGKVGCYTMIGLVHYMMSDFQIANENFQNALDISIKLGSITDEIGCYLNMGPSYHGLGEFEKVIEYQTKVLEKIDYCENPEEKLGNLGKCYGNLAMAYQGLGKLSKSLDYQEKSLEIAQKIGDKQEEGANYIEMGETYRYLGNLNRALEAYQKSLEIAKDLRNKRLEASCYSNIGIVYRLLKQFNKALEYQQKALKIREEIKDNDGVAKSCLNLANVYGDLNNFPMAIEYFQRSAKFFKDVGSKSGLAHLYLSLGATYKDFGDTNKAMECYDIALKITQEIGDKVLESQLYHNIGNYHFQKSDYQKSLDFAKKSLYLISMIKEVLVQEVLSLSLLKTKIGTYDLGINSALMLYEKKQNQDYLKDSLEIIERTKSRELIKKLNVSKKEEPLLKEHYEKLRKFEDQIIILEKKINCSPNFDACRELNALYIEKVRIIDEIYVKSTDPSSLIPSVNINIVEQFWKSLNCYKNNCSVLEMYIQGNRILYFLFNKDEYRFFIQEITDELIKKANIYFEHERKFKFTGYIDIEEFYNLLDDLVNQLLPQKLKEELATLKFEDLFIIPHRWLHHIAWEGANIIDDTPLGIRYNLVRYYSLDLARSSLVLKKETNRSALIVSNPTLDLPGAAKEGNIVNKKFEGLKKEFISGEKARLSTIKELLPKVSIAHFSCHAEFDLKDPFKSQIYLSDQSIIAADISLMDLRYSPFIFLNACETGQAGGKTEERLEDVGDELMGFVRAFTMANASTIVVTQWKIRDDVAVEFAESFYDIAKANPIGETMRVGEALKLARSKTYEKYKDQSRDWASYVLYGNSFKRLW